MNITSKIAIAFILCSLSAPLLWGQEVKVAVEIPKWQEWETQLETLKKEKLSVNFHRTDLEGKMTQLQAGLKQLSDTNQIRQVNNQLKAWDKEARFFQQKEDRLLNKINRLQAKIDKAKNIHQKVSTVEQILKNGGKKKFDFKKLGLLGGNFGASWGGFHNPKEYYLNISPQVGYKITEKNSVGLGLTCISEQRRLQPQNPVGSDVSLVQEPQKTYASNTIYGVKMFSRWVLHKSFFTEAQAEALNGKNEVGRRHWQPALWAGTGYQLAVGKHWGINLTLRYNLLHNQNSFYRSAMDFQVGIQLPGNGLLKAERKSTTPNNYTKPRP